jgi:hypothetical protein
VPHRETAATTKGKKEIILIWFPVRVTRGVGEKINQTQFFSKSYA